MRCWLEGMRHAGQIQARNPRAPLRVGIFFTTACGREWQVCRTRSGLGFRCGAAKWVDYNPGP